MTKFKVGDKVRVLDASAILGGRMDYYDGMETKVVRMYSGYPILQSKDGTEGVVVTDNEFLAIEKITGGDTMNYRTVKRKARVGERILITDARQTDGHYRNGDIATVRELFVINVDALYVQEWERSVYASEYEVIVEDSDNPRITALEAAVSELDEQVAELKAKVQTLEKADKPAVTNVTFNASPPNDLDELVSRISMEFRSRLERLTSPKLTPNQQRKATIERAKAFVEDVKERAIGNNTNDDGNYTFNHKTTKLTFHVNAEKRVVTALAHGAGNGKLYGKAFAKCAPGDVFNADIGMAIAAGRLYGLDVSEFVNAVQPTEVVVGQVVKSNKFHDLSAKVTEWRPKFDSRYPNGKAFGHTHDNGFLHTSRVTIIDDTEAQY